MALSMSKKDLEKLLSKNKIKMEDIKEIKELPKKKRTNKDRLSDAITLLSAYENNDKIYFNEDCSKCMLEFENVLLISTNDSLRLGARTMSKYKRLWHERVQRLVSNDVVLKWNNSKKEKLLIEFLYEVKTSRFMDYDGRTGAFKAPLDGLTESKMIIDDSEEYIPLIFGKQKKAKDGIPKLKIILSVENDFNRFFSNEFLKILND